MANRKDSRKLAGQAAFFNHLIYSIQNRFRGRHSELAIKYSAWQSIQKIRVAF